MRFNSVFTAALFIGVPGIAAAQVPQAPAATKPAAYNTTDTELGVLLDDPAAKAVLEKYIPQMVNSEQIGMARSLTLKALQQYAGDTLTDDVLSKINADLAKVPAK